MPAEFEKAVKPNDALAQTRIKPRWQKSLRKGHSLRGSAMQWIGQISVKTMACLLQRATQARQP